jgi:hypothetical protein
MFRKRHRVGDRYRTEKRARNKNRRIRGAMFKAMNAELLTGAKTIETQTGRVTDDAKRPPVTKAKQSRRFHHSPAGMRCTWPGRLWPWSGCRERRPQVLTLRCRGDVLHVPSVALAGVDGEPAARSATSPARPYRTLRAVLGVAVVSAVHRAEAPPPLHRPSPGMVSHSAERTEALRSLTTFGERLGRG